MATLQIHCIDANGNHVVFVTSPHKGAEVLEKYPVYQKWIADNGLTQIQPSSTRKPKQVWKINGKVCPKCGKQSWDNRAKIQSGEFNPKSPHFVCSDKVSCKWAVWKDQYEIIQDVVEQAKQVFNEPPPPTEP